ncbi:MAG: argininosuccinate synthase [Deltaproteobacteria bacterium RBG_13_47_9]|nr:MAG: argininosuccinate synthase [Deltaproteobacteria bacterium RBG_13_47_9]
MEQTETPKVNKVAVAYSGGLNSTLGIEFLRRKYKAKKIIPITIDVGQGEEEILEGRRKAKILKINPLFFNLQKEFTECWIARAIQANSDCLGYPISASMARQIVAKKVAEVAQAEGCDALLEGSSGKGNNPYCMHNVFKMLAPEMKILVPGRDFDMTRLEEEVLCREWGVPVTGTITGGDDKTMWCRSVASGSIELNQPLPDDIWMWYRPPEKAPDQSTCLTLEFEKGIPVKLNGIRRSLGEIIPELNMIGGVHSIGKIDIFENGIMDLKRREIYEAPAATLLLKTHQDLEQFCLTKDEIQFKKGVDQKWAYLIYHGMAYHPLRNHLDAFIETSQKRVNGQYKIKLFKGNIEMVNRESKTGLFSPEIRSMNAGGFNQRRCADRAFIRGFPFEISDRKENR